MDISKLIEEAAKGRWSEARAWSWYDSLPWLAGCNFIPSGAINQLEMWQTDTFNPQELDRELGWLAGIGMNTARVFLHDLLWEQDAKGFLSRMEQFLDIAHRHQIGILFVFFDSCWHPFPCLGRQREPEPGVHNSFWLQSPGVSILRDAKRWNRLEDYVCGVVGHFRNDARVHGWDIWNEPENPNAGSYAARDMETGKKAELVLPLLAQSFQWARSARPEQPLTSGVWTGEGLDWDGGEQMPPLPRFQLNASDVISFHRYCSLELMRSSIELLKKFRRPLLCSEYLARGNGSTFQAIMPFFKQEKIAAYNWGAVTGKTQTNHPWGAWQEPFTSEPVPWHHDIFRRDGSPYDPKETALIKSLLGR
jgi:hypothetical protein